MINLIAAVGENFELGKNNKLLWHLPNDLKFFKEMTLNKTIVMGRKTFASIGRALPKRNNIVITRDTNLKLENVTIYHDIETVIKEYENREIFIIGGASIYKQFIDLADKIYLTEIEACADDADTFFPYFDKNKYEKQIIANNSDNGINYIHCVYIKNIT